VRFCLAIVLVLGSVVACDHRPAPPQQQASEPPPASPPGVPVTGADAGVATVADAGAAAVPGDAVLVVSDDCLQVAAKIAQIIIDATSDPTQKAALEQDRTKLVRRSAETCMRSSWPAGARKCFLAASTPQQLEACGRELAAP